MKNTHVLFTGISLLIFLGALFGLYRLLTNGSVLPQAAVRKSGVMYFEGEKNVVVNKPFAINVMIDSNNQNVNAAGFYLKYDNQKVIVTDITTLKSFCQFYPEKKYDNRLGQVSLACGAPHPGFKGKSELIRITFLPLSIGTSALQVDGNSKLLLSDGKATNILTEFPVWEVQIGAGL